VRVATEIFALFLGLACLRSESFAQGRWFRQPIQDESDIFAVAALDEHTTIALDAQGRVLRARDGFALEVQSTGTTSPIYGLSFVYPTFGTAVGDSGTILRTTDGGGTWLPKPSKTSRHLQTVS